MNCIRLGVHWAGVEPIRGTYDQAYITNIRRIIQSCQRQGIYVLIEFHQDLLARQFNGHGVPDWFVGKSWLRGWRKYLRYPVPLRFKPVKTDNENIPDPEQSKGLTWYLSKFLHEIVLCGASQLCQAYFSFAVANAFGKCELTRGQCRLSSFIQITHQSTAIMMACWMHLLPIGNTLPNSSRTSLM